jgi:hypothetical protein
MDGVLNAKQHDVDAMTAAANRVTAATGVFVIVQIQSL